MWTNFQWAFYVYQISMYLMLRILPPFQGILVGWPIVEPVWELSSLHIWDFYRWQASLIHPSNWSRSLSVLKFKNCAKFYTICLFLKSVKRTKAQEQNALKLFDVMYSCVSSENELNHSKKLYISMWIHTLTCFTTLPKSFTIVKQCHSPGHFS
jgi:hypothetical protein